MLRRISTAIIAAILLTAFSPAALSQEAKKQGEKKHVEKKARFVVIYSIEAAWKGKPLSAMPFAAHSEYVEKLAEEKKLLVGGPFSDLTGAILIIQAASESEAKEIAHNDPLVKQGVVRAEIRGWHVAIKGCVD